MLLHLLVDLRPLRESKEFRRLWAGQSLSSIGSSMTGVAVPIQVYSLTHSSIAVGAIGLATAAPMLTLGLFGGSIADAVDRRKLAMVTSVGLLYASIGVGGLVAAVLSGPLGRIRRQGRAMLIGTAVWGAAIAGMGSCPWLWLAVAMLAAAGAADIVTTVMRATILQVNTPDELRGRLNGLDFVVGVGAPKLGDIRAGTVAGLAGPAVSTITGGIACVIGAALLTLAAPAFTRYDTQHTDRVLAP